MAVWRPIGSYLSFRPIGKGYTKQYINSSKLAQGLKVPPMTLGSKLKRGTVKNSRNLRPGGSVQAFLRKMKEIDKKRVQKHVFQGPESTFLTPLFQKSKGPFLDIFS